MIRFFARHPTAAEPVDDCLPRGGLFSVGSLRRETFPDFTASELEIRIVYPGATAEEVEEGICQRVEDALDGVKFVLEMRSDAREGVGIVTVEMDDAGEFPAFKDDVESAIDAIDNSPSDAEDAVITQLNTTDLVIALLVAGDMTPSDLKAHCEALKLRLQQIEEVSLVEVKGFSDHQLRIELSAQALQRYGLSVADVAGIVGRQSVDIPTGSIQSREQDILVRFVEQRRSTQELEDLIILGAPGGAEVRLRDLGQITDRFELAEDKVTVRARRAGLLQIRKTSNQDTIRVADAVKEFVADERLRQPNVEILVTQDGSTLVNDRLQMLIKKRRARNAAGFPRHVDVLQHPSVILGRDESARVISRCFLLLASPRPDHQHDDDGRYAACTGLLMDDGIVIAENIASHRARGKSGMASCRRRRFGSRRWRALILCHHHFCAWATRLSLR